MGNRLRVGAEELDLDPPRGAPAPSQLTYNLPDQSFENQVDRLDRIDRAVKIHARFEGRVPGQGHERFVDPSQRLIEARQQRRPEARGQRAARQIHHLTDRFDAQMMQGLAQLLVQPQTDAG